MSKLPLFVAISALAITGATGFAGASPERAGHDPGGPCDTSSASEAFAGWDDKRDYVLSPDGSFEAGGTGWTFEAGAAVVADGASLLPESPGAALSIPAGASATSPPICIQKGMPSARMFAVETSPKRGPSLRIDVLYPARRGAISKAGGQIRVGTEWDATRRFSLAQGRAVKGGTVQLQFRSLPDSDNLVDGVYIDPEARH